MGNLTLASQLTILRIMLIPAFVLLVVDGRLGAALLVFAFAGITDALDGLIARCAGQRTSLGAWLDPMADKLLLVSVFITLAWVGLVPGWLAAVAVTRDFVIGIGAGVYKWLFGPLEGRPTVPSKLNTLVQLLFVIAVVWRAAFPEFPQWPVTSLGALVLVTTAVSGVDYVVTYARKAVAVGRARRAAA